MLQGDCRKVVPALVEQGTRFQFAFLDPPFNIGQDYRGYLDKKEQTEYINLIDESIEAVWHSLADNGVMALHGPDQLCERYLFLGSFLKLPRIAWINWHYRFGQCGRGNWIDARCHCLIFAKGKNYTWNADDVLVESDRVAYGDKRVNETENGGRRLPGTVWGVPSDGPYWGRVQGNSEERQEGHPNQLPEVYLERLLRAYTNRGDRVLDPFAGSGTTVVVAQALNRHCVTIDVSEESVASVKERLKKGAVRVRV